LKKLKAEDLTVIVFVKNVAIKYRTKKELLAQL